MLNALPVLAASLGPSFVPSGVIPSDQVFYNTDQGGSDLPGLFIAFFVLTLFIGIAALVWRVSTARRIAEQNGLDVGTATRVALLNDNAVTATYLAGTLRQQRRPAPATATTPVRSVKARLAELQQLHESGDITDDEYAEGRKHVINGA
jgi:hypothetical protein